MKDKKKLIITAASKSYGPSLLALIGSLNCNWQNHPPVLVYDIGLDEGTLDKLRANEIPVRKVPAFCSHWRKHFTWKFWCWNDAPADCILWIDAGVVVMRSLDEVFEAISRIGYFIVPSYHELIENAHVGACKGCNVSPEFRKDRMTLLGGFVGMDKTNKMGKLVVDALNIAHDEKCIASTDKILNNDQAIFSILMYKYFGSLILSDKNVYLNTDSPIHTSCQKVWVHHGTLEFEDREYYSKFLSASGHPYLPQIPIQKGIIWFILHPKHVLNKIVEKGLLESARLIFRLIGGKIGLIKTDKSLVWMGLRD